ncbi:GNAT family N-acetyltransferase [Sanguibacter sp. 4.1]|uniref:GNAT family N-acetyltransferase n=1 Tax=Sanguibacter biliveldensis TaxID=3030830 RepID=A0AAF0Z5N3_9MICO|nr:GNAT family N-acetyltransferase [Sanguibacter sp. 4.1]WPF81416.1 GNAT family N-acetyltransferase [Sanguibacter sp. 4.1]
MTITIRPAQPDDTHGVRYVGTVAWPATYGSEKGSGYVMSGLDEFWSAEAIGSAIRAGDVDVAEAADGITGMVHVEELGGDLVMWKLYVLPDHQRHGIGRLLVRAAKDRARAQGKDLLTEYESSNDRVRGFYLREGFSTTAAPWPGTDAVWLRWKSVPDAHED